MNDIEREFYYAQISFARRALIGMAYESSGQGKIEVKAISDHLESLMNMINMNDDNNTIQLEEEPTTH